MLETYFNLPSWRKINVSTICKANNSDKQISTYIHIIWMFLSFYKSAFCSAATEQSCTPFHPPMVLGTSVRLHWLQLLAKSRRILSAIWQVETFSRAHPDILFVSQDEYLPSDWLPPSSTLVCHRPWTFGDLTLVHMCIDQGQNCTKCDSRWENMFFSQTEVTIPCSCSLVSPHICQLKVKKWV